MAAPPPDLVEALPEQARAPFIASWPDAPDEVEHLRSRISGHAVATHGAASRNDAVDLSLSLRIAGRLREAVDDWNALTTAQRSAVQAAIGYYALSADADDDLHTLMGFEDDAAVANIVLAWIGRDDLVIRYAKP
jgi:hypothetical protein